MTRIPALVRKGWTFEHMWIESLQAFNVVAAKYMWGIRKHFYGDWEEAHVKAADWAEAEERIINGPDERRDTEPAPAMEGAAE